MLLQHEISARARENPEAPALAYKDTRLTYRELDETSNRLAHLLVHAGCRPGDRIGLLMPKAPWAIVSLLATLKADAICVPMNSSNPVPRQAKLLELAECRCVLAGGKPAANLAEILAAATLRQPPIIGWLDEEAREPARVAAFTQADLAAYPARAREYQNDEDAAAEILFTSGSTGIPKGVVITHSGIAHCVRWARDYFGVQRTDRLSLHSSLHFDLATFDTFTALSSGAELNIVPAELNTLPHKLAQFIRTNRLTQWLSVPAALNLMANFDVLEPSDFPTLRRVIFGGEVLPTAALMHWMERLPHVQFTNIYGPTETTICSTYYTVARCPADRREPIPLGNACPGEQLLVLDRNLERVPPGTIADLYIRGVGLSPGYWREPDKTRAVFIEHRWPDGYRDRLYKTGDLASYGPDGLLHFHGRADTQIKCRGYRIELGDIESALGTLAGLRESAVVAIPSEGFEGSLICCAYAPAPEQPTSPRELRLALQAQLPAYMLPARWRQYESLPRNANDKVDRVQLKQDFMPAATSAPNPTLSMQQPVEGTL